MDLTRRSFLAGIGSVSVGLLFHRQLDRVLASLEQDLVDEPQTPEQQPSAALITVRPQSAFRPERLILPIAIAPLFVLEDIWIGATSQFVTNAAVPAELFTGPDANLALDAAAPGTEIRFRVRYVGDDPRGARFQAALIGSSADGRGKLVLPIDSGCAITA